MHCRSKISKKELSACLSFRAFRTHNLAEEIYYFSLIQVYKIDVYYAKLIYRIRKIDMVQIRIVVTVID